MPPPSGHDTHEEQNLERFTALSDSDVRILDEILRTAEQAEIFETLPFHAIFPAYSEVLARNGISTSHDRLYLRFLYRLEKLRRPGQALYEAFEEQLAAMGIEIRFSSESEGDGAEGDLDTEEVVLGETEESLAGGAVAAEQGKPTPRPRRASFSTFIDFEEEITKPRARSESRASISRLQDHSGGFGSRMPRKREKVVPQEQEHREAVPSAAKTSQPMPNTKSISKNRAQAAQLPERLRNPRPVALPQVEHARHTEAKTEKRNRLTRNSREPVSSDESATASSASLISEELPIPPELVYRPTYTQLIRDAEAFEDFRNRDLVRKLLRKWADIAENLRHENRILHLTAIKYDRGALIRQAFDSWRHLHRIRKHVRDTERFFKSLEKRADRARDAYLLTKAFTHWAECAAEEQERTSVARRHIIRLRYFSAWREITAVNDFKVRQHGLRKFFAIWKQVYTKQGADEDRAVVTYQGNLVEAIYWRWFWAFCEARAPEWRKVKTKGIVMRQWIKAIRLIQERNARVDEFLIDDTRHRVLSVWHERTGTIEMQQQRAAHLTAVVNRRLAATALQKLAHVARLEQQAERISMWRIMRHAWTAWNDRLRWQTLQHQIDDRLLVQALYKWVLAERSKLLERLNEERVVRRAFDALVSRHRMIDERNQQSFELITRSRDANALRGVLCKWRLRLNMSTERTQNALEFHKPRLLQESMHCWHQRCAHLADMQRWSAEAVFYLRASRSLKLWRSAVSESHRRKLKDAYSIARRSYKIRLASSTLVRWKERTTQNHLLLQDADSYDRNRLVNLSADIFHGWHDRSLRISNELYPLATAQNAQTLLSVSLQAWLSRSQIANNQLIQAQSFTDSHIEKVACEALHRLLLQVVDHRALASKAVTMQSWNDKRYLRVLLRQWSERAMMRRSPAATAAAAKTTRTPMLKPGMSSSLPVWTQQRSIHQKQRPEQGGTASNIPAKEAPSISAPLASRTIPKPTLPSLGSAWPPSSIDEPPQIPDNNNNPSIARAGYFSTPSKRAARARALAGVPVPTPMPSSPPAASIADTETSAMLLGTTVAGTNTSYFSDSGAGGGGFGQNQSSNSNSSTRAVETPLVRTLFRRGGGGDERLASTTPGSPGAFSGYADSGQRIVTEERGEGADLGRSIRRGVRVSPYTSGGKRTFGSFLGGTPSAHRLGGGNSNIFGWADEPEMENPEEEEEEKEYR